MENSVEDLNESDQKPTTLDYSSTTDRTVGAASKAALAACVFAFFANPCIVSLILPIRLLDNIPYPTWRLANIVRLLALPGLSTICSAFAYVVVRHRNERGLWVAKLGAGISLLWVALSALIVYFSSIFPFGNTG
jgi:hypothetical protein